ncbi:hypothetical protein NHX12_012720 [Muraenolepis orangiensis]|uniref:SPIN-DOC-like zinc-finger domain-containing protein n=3 Tax=Muraenolepis orangiensis TaxID=630683 RepID=A0A9Q0DCZ9_9TELE|nr:hypothetical protein NHX12_012720 [Muraenolepis orangiensis]
MAKRKKDDEYRTFQDEWTEEFAFVERAGSAVCLICNDKITSLKRSNVKRHFDTRHATFASKYPAGDSRKKACQELLSRVQASQQQLRVWTRQGDYNSASFAGSLAIVRNGKPFTDGEYAKTFMLDVANELFDDLPNKDKIIKRIQDMPLSARTVHDRTIVMANKVEETQVKDINAAPFFSLALDESTDMCDRQFGEVMSLVIRVINFIVARALNDRQFKTLLDEVNNYPGLLLHSNVRWLSRGKVLSRFAACLNEIRTFLEMKGVGHPELADTEWLLKFYYLVDLTEHLNQLNVKMQGIGNTVLSLQQAVFAFENKLELFITDLETGRLLHFEKLSQFKDACTASEPIQNLDLHQLAGCTSSLLQSFKARFGEFREHTRLFKFITHPNECSLNTADLNYIPGVSVRDFEAEVADLKASDMWVNKFKSLNEDLERITRQKAELASKHMWTEMKKLQPEDQLILKTWNALPVTYHTLQRMKKELLKKIIETKSKIAVLADESTSVGHKSTLIVFLKASVDGDMEPIAFPLDLVELDSMSAAHIKEQIMGCLLKNGFTVELLREILIGFCSDGASVMLGVKSGVGKLLQDDFPGIILWHCLNHRLELAVDQALDVTGGTKDFQAFMDSLYSLYSQSPKNMRQLSECAHNLDIALRRIGKVFSVGWVASSWRAVSAVWQSYPALAQHFREASEDDTRDSRERAKFKGLLSKLCSINFLKSLALMADVLTELKNLSEILQNRKTTLPKAHDIMTTYVKCIESFNRYPGQHAVDASQAEEVMEFKGRS